ncbi:MAG: KOW domain-containing RNA-binding protein [Lachnospiraceae bacterium]|nr:KOW domain-containing RNA-binding protein [Lachnospiraceae bacterium]
MVGCFARSLAGHDQGTVYIVIEETDRFVLVADGRIRTIEHPKRKNRKHIQLTAVRGRMENNEAIKHSIKEFLRRTTDV